MFVVSRKSEESVIVDGFHSPERSLKVTVLEVKGGQVKLGIEINADAHDAVDWPSARFATVAGYGARGQEVLMK
jgi:hypothetical protein